MEAASSVQEDGLEQMERDLREADPLHIDDPRSAGRGSTRQAADEWIEDASQRQPAFQPSSGTYTQVGLSPQEPPAHHT